jgi:hypothetical protein
LSCLSGEAEELTPASLAAMVSQEFLYNPLNREFDDIRLLTLKAGDDGDEIQCFLSHHSLNQAPVFEALSYAWGDSAENHVVSVNGNMVHVRESLYSVLSHLRRRSEDRVLWIDTICIDTNNTAEKNHQVRMMKMIYGCSDSVAVICGKFRKWCNGNEWG